MNGGEDIEVLDPGILRQFLAVAATVERHSVLESTAYIGQPVLDAPNQRSSC